MGKEWKLNGDEKKKQKVKLTKRTLQKPTNAHRFLRWHSMVLQNEYLSTRFQQVVELL